MHTRHVLTLFADRRPPYNVAGVLVSRFFSGLVLGLCRPQTALPCLFIKDCLYSFHAPSHRPACGA